MIDQLLLCISLAFVVFLAAFRRDRSGLPWIGMGLSVLGILLLVTHSLRDQFTGPGWAWLSRDVGGSVNAWRFLELISLILVGTGVTVMSWVADTERRSRTRGQAVSRAASEAGAAAGVLMSVLKAAPGAALMLRRPEVAGGGLRLLYADDRAREILHGPASGVVWLGQLRPRDLAEQVESVALEAIASGSMARRECPAGERWFEIAAGVHAEGVLVLLTDITERKRAEHSLVRAAFTDPVTGLANRAFLEREMEEGVARARREPEHRFAVLCLDFDDFKGVNDRHGHRTGDELLVSIGTRLVAVLDDEFAGNTERYVAARWGGDEFVLILHQPDPARVAAFADRLRERLARPHVLSGVSIRSTASIGAAMCSGTHESAAALLHDADTAMYAAKNEGKDRVRVAWDQGAVTSAARTPRRRATDIGPDTGPNTGRADERGRPDTAGPRAA